MRANLLAVLKAAIDQARPPEPPRGVDPALWARRDSLRFAYARRVHDTTAPELWGRFRTTDSGPVTFPPPGGPYFAAKL